MTVIATQQAPSKNHPYPSVSRERAGSATRRIAAVSAVCASRRVAVLSVSVLVGISCRQRRDGRSLKERRADGDSPFS